MRLVRIRELFSGTAGAITGFVKIPISKRTFQKKNVRTLSPTMIGMIGVTDSPVSNPSDCSPVFSRSALRHSRSRRSGSRFRMRRHSRTVATA